MRASRGRAASVPTRIARGSLVVLLSLPVVLAGGTAWAAGAPAAGAPCTASGDDVYDVSPSYTHLPSDRPGTRAYASPGTTIVMEQNRPFDVRASPLTTAAVDAPAVLARLSASEGVPVSASASVDGGGTGSWTVPADQPSGWLEVGGAGYQVDWRRTTCSGDGTLAVVASGTMQGATARTSFSHG